MSADTQRCEPPEGWRPISAEEMAAAEREQSRYVGPEGMWVIFFHDAGVKPEVFIGPDAESAARRRYFDVRQGYNCALLCGAPLAPVTPPATVSALVEALEAIARVDHWLEANQDAFGAPAARRMQEQARVALAAYRGDGA